jgi:EmrB/QacA subfamily drug resistance transporter
MASANTATRPTGAMTAGNQSPVQGRQLLLIMGGVMLGLLLAALDQTIVGPAMFKIIKDLKGLEHYAWVTTAYLLTSTVSVPVFGKLGDLYGRKWFFVGGMVIFMIGSALSGLSSGTDAFNLAGFTVPGLTTGMAELIFFRAFQGIGGGLMFASAFTIVGDLVPPAERGRWQGLFGAVWGLASVVGPTVGGYITDNIGWQWVFYVNIPVGFLAIAVVVGTLPNIVQARGGRRSIDWLGALAIVAGTTPILLALSLGGSTDFPWDSPQTIGLFVAGAVLIAAFIFIEFRAKEPLIPMDLFRNRVFTFSIITVFLVGVGMFGAIINIPLFIQGVQGDSATSSGNAITPMMLANVAVAAISGQILSRTGRYRWLAIFGGVALTAGMFLLSTMGIDTPRWQTIVFMIVMGLGMGVALPLYTLVVQNAFPPQRLGVVTSATTFFRSIGSTVGVAVLGTIVNNRFSSDYAANLAPQVKANPQFSAFLSSASPQALISPETITTIQQQLQTAHVPAAQIPTIIAAIQAPIKPALSAATTESFLIGAAFLGLSILSAALIPEIQLRRANARAAMVPEGAGEAVGKEFAEGLPGSTLSPEEAQEIGEAVPVGGR